jgi:ABC-type amino acid transport system permease subunit
MKTIQMTVISLLVATAALILVLAGLQLTVSAIAVGGLFAIAFGDYRHEIKPLPAALATVTPFRPLGEMLAAA